MRKTTLRSNAGASGAAETFLKARPGGYNAGASMCIYFELVAALPKGRGDFVLHAREGLMKAFGPEIGEALMVEIRNHPAVSRGAIAQVFAAHKTQILALLETEVAPALEAQGPAAPPTPGAPKGAQPGAPSRPALSARADASEADAIDALPGLVRYQAQLLRAGSVDAKRSARDRAAAAAQLAELLKNYGGVIERQSSVAAPVQ